MLPFIQISTRRRYVDVFVLDMKKKFCNCVEKENISLVQTEMICLFLPIMCLIKKEDTQTVGESTCGDSSISILTGSGILCVSVVFLALFSSVIGNSM